MLRVSELPQPCNAATDRMEMHKPNPLLAECNLIEAKYRECERIRRECESKLRDAEIIRERQHAELLEMHRKLGFYQSRAERFELSHAAAVSESARLRERLELAETAFRDEAVKLIREAGDVGEVLVPFEPGELVLLRIEDRGVVWRGEPDFENGWLRFVAE